MLICGYCEFPITASDPQIVDCDGPAHTRCRNDATEARRAYAAECEDREGFRDRVPMRRAAGSETTTNLEKGRVA